MDSKDGTQSESQIRSSDVVLRLRELEQRYKQREAIRIDMARLLHSTRAIYESIESECAALSAEIYELKAQNSLLDTAMPTQPIDTQ